MQTRLFIGNLSWNTTDADLSDMAAAHGDVVEAKVITDRDTGRSRGFGFLTLENANADAVIHALDGQDMDGRAIRVSQANDKPQRERGSFDGGHRRDRY